MDRLRCTSFLNGRALLAHALVFIVCSTSFLSCREPVEPAKTYPEIALLLEHMKESPPAGNWKDFNLLRGISNETLEFLSQDFTESETKAALSVMPALGTLLSLPDLASKANCPAEAGLPTASVLQNTQLLRTLRTRLSGAQGFTSSAGLALDQNGPPTLAHANLGEALEKALNDKMAALKREHKKIFGERRHENEVYCEDECTCIANNLGAAVKAADPGRTVLYVFMTGGCAPAGVCPYPDAEPPPKDHAMMQWTSHEAIAVGNSHGEWNFVDPLVFGDTKGHSAAEWYARFQHKTKASYFVSPKAVTLGWDQ